MKEREILLQSITDHKDAIAKAEQELTALDKPELRHGDYGFKGPGVSRLMINSPSGSGELIIAGCDTSHANGKVKIKLGNIFDDLKAMSEDLEKFEAKNKGGAYENVFRISCTEGITIENKADGAMIHFAPEQYQEIRQKLSRLMATAKKRQ